MSNAPCLILFLKAKDLHLVIRDTLKDPAVKDVDPAFRPGPTSSFHLVRKTLLAGVMKYRHALTGRMMDYGCGQSPYKALFSHTDYTGVDTHRSGFPEADKHADVFLEEDRIPFADRYFNAILCTEVFEHVFDLPGTLKELHRVLKPGGKMLITCPFIWELHEEPWDFARYTPYALKHLLNEAGFEVEVHERAGHPIEAIAQQCIVYYTNGFFPRIPKFIRIAARPLLWHFCIAGLNSAAVILTKLLPRYTNLYLCNILLVHKREEIQS